MGDERSELPYSAYFNYTHLNLSLEELSRRYRSLISQSSESVPVDASTIDSLRHIIWNSLVGDYLAIAQRFVDELDRGASVMIQGDASLSVAPVLTSLVQLCVESHCRTFEGFCALVDKGWIAYAFPFSSASESHTPYAVFYLFMNVTWLVMQRYPTAFEFNEGLLIAFLDNVHSKRFTTFLFDSEKERAERASGGASLYLRLSDKSVRAALINTRYDSSLRRVLSLSSINVMPWTSLLLRYNPWYHEAQNTSRKALETAVQASEKDNELTLIDELMFALPTVSSTTALTKLNISQTQLSHAPLWISELSSLKELLLEDNRLAYVPPTIDKLVHLERLSLAQNRIVILDEALCNLKNLKSLVLDNNEVHSRVRLCVNDLVRSHRCPCSSHSWPT